MRYILFLMTFLSSLAFASGEIAVCNGPLTGYSYYPFDTAWMPGKFDRDKIGNSKITVRTEGDHLDVFYMDNSRSIKSATQEGAKVLLLQAGSRDFTIGVFYPNELTEIYVFSKNGPKSSVALQLARAGDDASLPKSALLVGACELVISPN